jgi:NAD(P)-dependent dehydrogenase (short-subunit alcohol dehydrogenase family)
VNDILIVGAGRGLGKQLLKNYSRENTVWTTFNTSTPDLPSDKSFRLDLGNLERMETIAQEFNQRKVSFNKVLFVGAETPPQDDSESSAAFLSGMSPDVFEHYLKINALGPLFFFERLYMAGLIDDPSTVIFFSSLAGSIEMRGRLAHNQHGGNLAYRLSKSALNCGVRNIAFDLSDKGVTVVSLHPGWVRTRSGGPHADIDEVTAGAAIASLIDSISVTDHGKFLHVDGSVIPW